MLQLTYARDRSDTQNIQIKLEIDTNPSQGSVFETKLLDFPTPFSVVIQAPSSLFAGKLHALLCRDYVKGRDWYDFIWYVTRKTGVNFTYLSNALDQHGPWKGKLSGTKVVIDMPWLTQELEKKVLTIDWKLATKDVENFIKPRELKSLELWNAPFFTHFIHKL